MIPLCYRRHRFPPESGECRFNSPDAGPGAETMRWHADPGKPDEAGGESRGSRIADAGAGVRINTSSTDFYLIKQMQTRRFDGEHWELFGPVIPGAVHD